MGEQTTWNPKTLNLEFENFQPIIRWIPIFRLKKIQKINRSFVGSCMNCFACSVNSHNHCAISRQEISSEAPETNEPTHEIRSWEIIEPCPARAGTGYFVDKWSPKLIQVLGQAISLHELNSSWRKESFSVNDRRRVLQARHRQKSTRFDWRRVFQARTSLPAVRKHQPDDLIRI